MYVKVFPKVTKTLECISVFFLATLLLIDKHAIKMQPLFKLQNLYTEILNAAHKFLKHFLKCCCNSFSFSVMYCMKLHIF